MPTPNRSSLQALTAVLGIALALGACAQSPSVGSGPAVAEIVDGDTISVDFGNRVEMVRLLGIDTPESVDPNRPVQCFGAEATARLTSIVPPGTPVALERDAEARDQYGRLLAYLFRSSDGLFVNEAMLRDGFADLSIYAPNLAYRDAFERAFTAAQTAERGLWSACGGADVPLDPPPNALGSADSG